MDSLYGETEESTEDSQGEILRRQFWHRSTTGEMKPGFDGNKQLTKGFIIYDNKTSVADT